MKSWQKYAAEAFGTFVLVGVGTGAILGTGVTGDPVVITVSLAFGLALLTGLYTVGRISGGHFNPAVSLAMFLNRDIGLTDTIGYWASQVAGALLASGAFAWVLSRSDVALTYTYINREAVGEFGAFVAEAVFTLVFVFAILVLARSEVHTKYLGMAGALAAVHFVGIPFTGASVNPARSLAPALLGSAPSGAPSTFDAFWVFLIGPAVGAALAWVLFKVIVEGDLDFSDDVEEIRDAATT